MAATTTPNPLAGATMTCNARDLAALETVRIPVAGVVYEFTLATRPLKGETTTLRAVEAPVAVGTVEGYRTGEVVGLFVTVPGDRTAYVYA